MARLIRFGLFWVASLLCLSACQQQAPLAYIPQRQIDAQKFTLGFVQSKLKQGSSGDDVVSILGSPNIVTSNKDGTETWVYDKVATEEEAVGGFSSAVKVKSTRTMIVVIKFDLNGKVKDVSYRQTSY